MMLSSIMHVWRKPSDAELHAEESSLVIEALVRSQAVIEFKPDGTIISANRNFCDAFGYQSDEIVGRHHRMFCDQDYVKSEEYIQFWANLARGDYKSGQFERIGNGGRRIHIQATYNPIRDKDGRVLKIVKFATDITERISNIETLADALQALADGNLSTRIDKPFHPEMARLRNDFNAALPKLEEAMVTVKSSVGEMTSGLLEISHAATDLSRRTETQAASLEETTAALAEITTTVKISADTASAARKLTGSAKVEAEKSGDVVRRAVEAMNGIAAASKEINQILAVIDEIAFQTNLLALNAGVEAARAGEAGRGFAVVASEVRALAQRSADAAKQIKSLISNSTTQVEKGVGLVGETGAALERIVTGVADINTSIIDIASRAEEQATAIAQLNAAIGEMDGVTQQNAAMVEETTAATRTLVERADDLSQLVSVFRTSNDGDGLRKALRSTVPHAFAEKATAPPRHNAARLEVVGERARSRGGASAAAISTDHDWEEF